MWLRLTILDSAGLKQLRLCLELCDGYCHCFPQGPIQVVFLGSQAHCVESAVACSHLALKEQFSRFIRASIVIPSHLRSSQRLSLPKLRSFIDLYEPECQVHENKGFLPAPCCNTSAQSRECLPLVIRAGPF